MPPPGNHVDYPVGFHSLYQGLDDRLEVIVSGLGFTDFIQAKGRRLGGYAEHLSPCRDVVRR